MKYWLTGLLIASQICLPGFIHAADLSRQHLFRVERSKNANIVQYDAQIDSSGNLFNAEPVIAYWVRLAEQGQVKELSWAQWTFAYGFETMFISGNGSVTLEMKADIDRRVIVLHDGENFRAATTIDGGNAYLDRVFVRSDRSGLFVSLESIELYGEDIRSAENRYEKIIFDP
ncbi:MAG: DUF4833 domain-containing protein [Xanthomonadales bacterium]|nr:DUF4833 domain-containing protein [Gammaproteobacteria bacterium]MBT8053491.1 DUF4833 domain-containing protein [Gammaproteobacteria bacterium]NND55859.1 DUF4833 domain-containing protein [Xanthomonadales bacterium]NNK50921.1 DUF4833 domain-containing protein [Xanthomonadales bacterium]